MSDYDDKTIGALLDQVERAIGDNLTWLNDALQPVWRTGPDRDREDCRRRLDEIESAWRAVVKAQSAINKARKG